MGFCDFTLDTAIRGMKLLNLVTIKGAKLLIKVDPKTQAILDEYSSKHFPPKLIFKSSEGSETPPENGGETPPAPGLLSEGAKDSGEVGESGEEEVDKTEDPPAEPTGVTEQDQGQDHSEQNKEEKKEDKAETQEEIAIGSTLTPVEEVMLETIQTLSLTLFGAAEPVSTPIPDSAARTDQETEKSTGGGEGEGSVGETEMETGASDNESKATDFLANLVAGSDNKEINDDDDDEEEESGKKSKRKRVSAPRSRSRDRDRRRDRDRDRRYYRPERDRFFFVQRS